MSFLPLEKHNNGARRLRERSSPHFPRACGRPRGKRTSRHAGAVLVGRRSARRHRRRSVVHPIRSSVVACVVVGGGGRCARVGRRAGETEILTMRRRCIKKDSADRSRRSLCGRSGALAFRGASLDPIHFPTDRDIDRRLATVPSVLRRTRARCRCVFRQRCRQRCARRVSVIQYRAIRDAKIIRDAA